MAKWRNVGEELPYILNTSNECPAVVDDSGNIHVLGFNGNFYQHFMWNGTTWEQQSTLPTSASTAAFYRGRLHMFHGNDHYVWGGHTGDSWEVATAVPSEYSVYEGTASVVTDDGIFILGRSGTTVAYCKQFFRWYWDGTQEKWDTSLGQLPYMFAYGQAVNYAGNIHILGSQNDTRMHYSWNLTSGQWVQEVNMPVGFYRGCAVVYDNKIQILGGSSGYEKNRYTIGTSEQQWTEYQDDLPYKFIEGRAVVCDNKIYILGGLAQPLYFFYYDKEVNRKNKIIYGNNTLLDLTQDTVTDIGLVKGTTAHDATGCLIKGALSLKEINASNISPVKLEIGECYKMLNEGKAVSTVLSVTPSYTNPASISNSIVVKPTKTMYCSSERNPVVILAIFGTVNNATSWATYTIPAPNPSGSYASTYDYDFLGWDGVNSLTWQAGRSVTITYYIFAWQSRNSSGTARYGGVRIKQNGNIVDSVLGSSSTVSPSSTGTFTINNGDVISIETRASATGGQCRFGVTMSIRT